MTDRSRSLRRSVPGTSHHAMPSTPDRRCGELETCERTITGDRTVNFWLHVFDSRMASMGAHILDIGCGCGRYAMLLGGYEMCGRGFEGRYTGISVDREMVEWCRGHFAPEYFRFHHADVFNKVYNPTGGLGDADYSFPLADCSQDFVFCSSLYLHILDAGLRRFINESYRVLAADGWMEAVVCCVDDVQGELDGRWTFLHEIGSAFVESVEYPEAAVAYRTAHLVDVCREAGFEEVKIVPDQKYNLIRCRK